MSDITHWYLHVDLDAFFASVEQLDHPEYRGKPVIVGGKPDDRRSVVSTASYEARKFGVHSAMPTAQAYKLCPQGIYVHGRMQRYAELSYQIMTIFKDFSPDVQQMSIDEAFIDITGTEKLFGPPEETALKIKKIVKENTGLTVSVGLATTKYLAKIASGYSKPDGFFHIKKGDEEKFMLSLPLNKVWGLGPKSLELLRNKGFRSTRDIYEKDFDTLNFLFGKNMAGFLYNVVRGNEKESFSKEAKSHSISAERTFPYDLTDIYTIETELLELAHGVFFRLLKEEAYSRTAFVKIRYDDFSTCSVQETLDKNISTLDSYFEILQRLFEKKYVFLNENRNKGIRLLGVGFENIETEEKPYQQELFENNDSKKQAVEQAILKLQKKHPEIKVRKARTFNHNKLKALLLLPLLLVFSPKAYSSENTVTQTGSGASSPDTFYIPSKEKKETPDSLFEYDINDKNAIEYSVSGFWQVLLSDSLLFSFGNNTTPGLSISTPVFKQEVELSSYFLLNKHWFFQGDFAEEFKKNTIAMGYKSDGFLRSFRLSNRNVTVPSGYSAELFGFGLTSGTAQAPGLSAHFQSSDNKLEADLLLRYDMTSTNSATFYGMNKVTDKKITISEFAYGFCYKFPDNTEDILHDIKDIYVETRRGNYTDSNGRKYKKLALNEYKYNSTTKRLYLSQSANGQKQEDFVPSIIVTFNNISNVDLLLSSTGSYSDEESFAGKIQAEFNKHSEKQYNLAQFSPDPVINIDNTKGIIIQNPQGFSPFLCSNYYDFGLNESSDIFVMNEYTESRLTDFITGQNDYSDFLYDDFIQEKHNFSYVLNSNNSENNYPFAESFPEIYLNLSVTTNIQIVQRNYTQVSEYQIGQDACSGTVQVYINNILDTGAVYNGNTGIVTLSQIPSTTDKIYIMWQEDSSDYVSGSISAGSGFKYHFTENLTGDAFVSAKWPIAFQSNYSTPDNIKNGFAAFSSGINYDSENFKISNKTALSIQTDNASDGLLVCSQENNTTQTYYLDSSSGYTTKTSPYISTENKFLYLSEDKNGTIQKHTGISDPEISGYKIPLSWDFSQDKNWASVDVKLASGYLLQNSSQFNIALKPAENITAADNIELYLQLGIKADKDFYGEDSKNISTWIINNIDFTKPDWQLANIQLSDFDKAKLSSDYDLRLIVVSKNNHDISNNGKGTIYVGPYEPVVDAVKTIHNENILITSTSIKNSKDNYSSVINWSINAATDTEDIVNTIFTISSYFKESDFSTYENIDLYFNVNAYNKKVYSGKNSDPGFSIVMENSSTGVNALHLNIQNIESFINEFQILHKLTINTKTNSIFIDNNELSSDLYTLTINKGILPSVLKLSMNTVQGNNIYCGGQLYINDLIFTNSKVYPNLQNIFAVEYNKPSEILTIGDFAAVKDFSAGFSSKQNPGDLQNISPVITSQAHSGVTISNIQIKSDVQLNQTQIGTAGHSFRLESPLFDVLQVQEQYRFTPSDYSTSKNNELSLDFNNLITPVNFKYSVSADNKQYSSNQNMNLSLGFNEKMEKIGAGSFISIKMSQKNDSKSNIDKTNSDYFDNWYSISEYELSTGDSKAKERKEELNLKLTSSLFNKLLLPSLNFNLQGEYVDSTSPSFQDITKLIFTIPVNFKNQSVEFSIARSGGDTKAASSDGNYLADSSNILKLQEERTYLYISVPFYELFQTDLINCISANYSTKYEIQYKRKLSNSMKDVFIPSNASFSIQRNIQNTSTVSDLYQYKTVLTNMSVNNFGKNSSGKYFNWFKQEEIISNLSAVIKVPANDFDNITMQLSSYMQILFLLGENSTLNTSMDFSLDSNLDWFTHANLILSKPGQSSMLITLIDYFSKDNFNASILRKNTVSAELSSKNRIISQKYSYKHNADFTFKKYFTLTTAMGLQFHFTEKEASNLGLELSLGGKAEF